MARITDDKFQQAASHRHARAREAMTGPTAERIGKQLIRLAVHGDRFGAVADVARVAQGDLGSPDVCWRCGEKPAWQNPEDGSYFCDGCKDYAELSSDRYTEWKKLSPSGHGEHEGAARVAQAATCPECGATDTYSVDDLTLACSACGAQFPDPIESGEHEGASGFPPGTPEGDAPEPQFQLGDRVQRDDGSGAGQVSYGPQWDDNAGTWKWKVQEDGGGQKWWNETSMVKSAAAPPVTREPPPDGYPVADEPAEGTGEPKAAWSGAGTPSDKCPDCGSSDVDPISNVTSLCRACRTTFHHDPREKEARQAVPEGHPDRVHAQVDLAKVVIKCLKCGKTAPHATFDPSGCPDCGNREMFEEVKQASRRTAQSTCPKCGAAYSEDRPEWSCPGCSESMCGACGGKHQCGKRASRQPPGEPNVPCWGCRHDHKIVAAIGVYRIRGLAAGNPLPLCGTCVVLAAKRFGQGFRVAKLPMHAQQNPIAPEKPPVDQMAPAPEQPGKDGPAGRGPHSKTKEVWDSDGKFSREVEADGVDDLVRIHRELNEMGLTKTQPDQQATDLPANGQQAPPQQPQPGQPGQDVEAQAWAETSTAPMPTSARRRRSRAANSGPERGSRSCRQAEWSAGKMEKAVNRCKTGDCSCPCHTYDGPDTWQAWEKALDACEWPCDCSCHPALGGYDKGGRRAQEGEGEPQEGDWGTEDHERFYEVGGTGRVVCEVPAGANTEEMWAALEEEMARQSFYPDVWFLSDHGNYHLMTKGANLAARAARGRASPRARRILAAYARYLADTNLDDVPRAEWGADDQPLNSPVAPANRPDEADLFDESEWGGTEQKTHAWDERHPKGAERRKQAQHIIECPACSYTADDDEFDATPEGQYGQGQWGLRVLQCPECGASASEDDLREDDRDEGGGEEQDAGRSALRAFAAELAGSRRAQEQERVCRSCGAPMGPPLFGREDPSGGPMCAQCVREGKNFPAEPPGWSNVSDDPGHDPRAGRRTAQPIGMPPAAAGMTFDRSNERGDGDRVVWDVSWDPEQVAGMSTEGVRQQVRSYVVREVSNEKDIGHDAGTRNWGTIADPRIEDFDEDGGVATVSFQTSEQAAPQFSSAEATE